MSNIHRRGSDFLSALAQFETCLETPVVSGELQAWLLSARNACEEVSKQLRREIASTHQELLDEIATQDMSLAPRLDSLKAKDDELSARCDKLHVELKRLCDRAERLESHELKLDEEVSQVTEQGLAFVIEARKQDTALTTWHLEAFNRDRGIAD